MSYRISHFSELVTFEWKQYYYKLSGDKWKVISFSFMWTVSQIFASTHILLLLWASRETIQKTHLSETMLVPDLLLLHYLFSQ